MKKIIVLLSFIIVPQIYGMYAIREYYSKESRIFDYCIQEGHYDWDEGEYSKAITVDWDADCTMLSKYLMLIAEDDKKCNRTLSSLNNKIEVLQKKLEKEKNRDHKELDVIERLRPFDDTHKIAYFINRRDELESFMKKNNIPKLEPKVYHTPTNRFARSLWSFIFRVPSNGVTQEEINTTFDALRKKSGGDEESELRFLRDAIDRARRGDSYNSHESDRIINNLKFTLFGRIEE